MFFSALRNVPSVAPGTPFQTGSLPVISLYASADIARNGLVPRDADHRAVLDEIDFGAEIRIGGRQVLEDPAQALPHRVMVLREGGADVHKRLRLARHDVELRGAPGGGVCTTVNVTEGSPRNGSFPQRSFSSVSNRSKARMILARRVFGLMPESGIAPCAILPVYPHDRPDGPLHADAEVVLFRLGHKAGSDVIRVARADEVLDAEHHPFLVADESQADLSLPRHARLAECLAVTSATASPAFMSQAPRP